MKITPFLLFCIILIVLVIFTIVSNNYAQQNNKEGFLAYQEKAASNSSIIIPQYSPSSQVNKIYDQLFFDNNNGNLIEVVSPADATGNSPDIAGNTITSVIVTNRSGTSNIYKISTPGTTQTIADSLIKTVQNNMYSWLYPSQTTVTDTYNVFYIPWHDNTYVYMINAKPIVATTPPTQVGAWLFGSANTSQQYLYTAQNNTIPITGFYADTDPNNGLVLGDTFYDPLKSVYQISHYVKFDLQNANLIIQTGDGSNKQITIYDRSGKPTTQTPISKAGTISNTNKTINNVSFQPFTIVDTAGQNLVIYMPSAKKTVIALISQTSATNKTYTLAKVCRFDYGGIDIGDGTRDYVEKHKYDYDDDDDDYKHRDKDHYNKNANSQFWNKDDYMLKTQIIPPVCPSCPACPGSSNVCTNCGGAGGSGTLSSNGNSSVIGTEGIAQSGAGVINNTVNTVGKLGEKTLDAAGNVIGGTAAGVGLLAGGTAVGAGLIAGGAINAAGEVAEGAGNLAGGAVNAVGNTIGGVASGIGNVIGGVASGAGSIVGGLASNAGNNQAQGQGQQLKYGTVPMVLGTQNQYTDQYSYYGQLPAKPPTNFMPVNTSFAAFGK